MINSLLTCRWYRSPVIVAMIAWLGGAVAQTSVGPVEGVDLRLSDGVQPVERVDTRSGSESERLVTRSAKPRFKGVVLKLTAQQSFDDNVLRSETDTQSDFVVNLKPSVELRGSYGKHKGRVGVSADYARYLALSEENYLDHKLYTQVELDVTRKLDLELKASYEHGHDARGAATSRLGGSSEPDLWTRRSVNAQIKYGRRIAKVQLVGSVEPTATRYTNNSQSIRDFNSLDYAVTGYWNVKPKLSALLEIGRTQYDYRSPVSALDSLETRYRLGLRWEATYKTTGEFKIGLLEKDFDDSSVEGFNGVSWEGSVLWEPKPFSKVRFFTTRETQEGVQAGASHLVSNRAGLRWKHGFTDHFWLDSAADYERTEFGPNREDDFVSVGSSLSYELNPWLVVGGGYTYSRRDSSQPGAGYRDNLIMLHVKSTVERGAF